MSRAPNSARPPRPTALDRTVEEARQHLTPESPPRDLEPSDELLARLDDVDRELAAEQREARAAAGSRLWLGMGGLAAAAAVVVALRSPATPPPPATSHVDGDTAAASLTLREGEGELRVGGEVASAERALRVGDRVETRGMRAVFVSVSSDAARAEAQRIDPQAQPGAGTVTWSLEDQSAVDLTRGAAPMVLALDHGAVEADVQPVPSGEVFAVDVDGLRIAVHGTHLRVERRGTKVVVDLTEGVISIGTPPRSGATYGTTVVAPAHAEVDLADPARRVQIVAQAEVRPAQRLGSAHTGGRTPPARAGGPRPGPQLPAQASTVAVRDAGAQAEPNNPSGPTATAVAEAGVAQENAPTSTQPVASSAPANAATPAPAEVPAPAASGQVPPRLVPDHDAGRVIAAGVRACARRQLAASGVRVMVSSKLSLRLDADGRVIFARFDPPLAPAAQDCSQKVIYGTRFDHAGTALIPIELD